MSDTSLNQIIRYGTEAERIAFIPDPAAGSQVLYIWYEEDNPPNMYIWNGSVWVLINAGSSSDGTATSVLGRAANSSGARADIAATADGQILQRLSSALVFSNLNIAKIVRKSADQSVTSSTALVNDTHLKFPIAASETWTYNFYLFIVGNGTGNFKVAIQAPALATVQHGVDGIDDSGTGVFGAIMRQVSTSLAPSGFSINNDVTATLVKFDGICVNGVNAGDIQLRWAQSTSNGTATTVQANSYVIAHRIE